MRQSLDKFILYFPVLFIKQYPYALIAAIALWTWPPIVSGVFLLIVAAGILALRWRSAAWISEMRRQHAPKNETFYIDRVPVPVERAVRNIAILLAVGGVVAWLFGERLGLTYWQTFLLIVGFGLLYLDSRFFGSVAIYIVTGGGIAIYFVPFHTDYRFFLRFNEMGKIVRLNHLEKPLETWTVCSRVRREAKSGVLLVPRYANGFSRLLDEVLLTPTNVDEFLKRVPSTLVTDRL